MQEKRIDTAKIEQLRKRRIARKRRVAALVILLVAAAAAYFTGVYGASLAVLGDVVDTVAISLSPGTGWPQHHNVSRIKSADDLSGGVVMLGDSDMVMYSPSGKILRSIQHGYGYPAISVGGKRVCLYNRSGRELKIESRSRTLNTIVTDQAIMLAKMSEGGGFALITESNRYAAEMTVYNSMFSPSFSWYSAEDNPITMAIDTNASHVSTGCIRAQGGGIVGTVYMFTTNSETPIATIDAGSAMPYMMKYLPNGDLMVIYDSFAAVYSEKDGSEKARYSYEGATLQTAEIEGNYTALIFASEAQENLTRLVALDNNMAVLAQSDIGRIVNDVKLTKTNIFVVLPQSVLSYNFEGILLGETPSSGKLTTVLQADKLLMLTDGALEELIVPKPPETK